MNTSLKIRLLLFLLTLSFIGTALTLRYTFHKEDILKNEGEVIEKHLHGQEQFVKNFLGGRGNFEALKAIPNDEKFAAEVFDLRKTRSLFIFTFKDHALQFWSGNRISLETDTGLKEGSNWVNYQNGWYEAIKRSDKNFSAVCFIPVKARYPIQNTYLMNVFSPQLITTDNLDIAGPNEGRVYLVSSSIDHRALFSLKLKSFLSDLYYSDLELICLMAAILLCCFLVNSVCLWVLSRGYAKSSILLLTLFFFAGRALTLNQNWFSTHFDLPVFDSKYYGSGAFYPSIGDLLLNVFACSWCILFAYNARNKIKLNANLSPAIRVALFALTCIVYALLAIHVDETLKSLVVNSSIRFDVTNILNLNSFSWIGILIVCMAALNLYLLLIVLLTVLKELDLSRYYVLLFAGTLLAGGVYKLIRADLTLYFILFSLIVYSNAWLVLKKGLRFNPAIFVLSLLLFSGIASLKLSDYLFFKGREARRVLAQNLELSDDPNAVLYFSSLEQTIAGDPSVVNYFKGPFRDYSQLKNKLQKFYFDGYLTRYELTFHEYGPDGSSLDNNKGDNLNIFKELVIAGTIKVSNYFYKVGNTFGTRHFFAILPVADQGAKLGTLVVELTSGTFESPDAFPRVLSDIHVDEAEKIRDYSFAFYKDGNLVNQYGSYAYKISPEDYTRGNHEFTFLKKDNFDHLIYRPNPRNLIIVSSSVPGILTQFGSVSFLFLVLLSFSFACAGIYWTWKNIILFKGGGVSRWEYLTGGGHILYKTRIQVSIVAAVISTLLIVGVVTYFNIIGQYTQQQEQLTMDRLGKITRAFEDQLFKSDALLSEQLFSGFADVNTADLSYFDANGRLIYTTQPKIYETRLVSSRINATAYYYLHTLHKAQFLNPSEQVGRMTFMSAYHMVLNGDHKIVGYLSLPSFSNEHDLQLRIGEFLNTMVNVYALVLVAIGFFAVFIANQVTAPLTLIQKSLSQIKIGTSNSPIYWKRNDEIGSLIREYNTMIEALEESANRLARSERETAWKEMAKQVAHEIKNPLTPLKLGVQLLDKSWREKDPNFNKKFERFSKSFIEQIESLSHIASEFSNFAKMPETSLESVKIGELVERSIEVYSKLSNVSIHQHNRVGEESMVKGDKDQLLRCFNNLIKNATESIPDSRHGMIHITIEQQDKNVLIELSDNGKGIPDGLKERIFNPNFTTKSSGTGLGLAFVKQAIENMAGSITFKTAHDTGTTFYIRLPLADS